MALALVAVLPSVPVPAVAQPVLEDLLPDSVCAGSGQFVLRVQGSGFDSGAKVRWGADLLEWPSGHTPSPGEVQGVVDSWRVASPGIVPITVLNANGALSENNLPFTIQSPPCEPPSPVISALAPSCTAAGGAALTLTVTGSGFDSEATVLWGEDELPRPSAPTATQVKGDVSESRIAAPGIVNVSVRNGSGANSGPLPFTIQLTPVISEVSPSSATRGSPAFRLIITGSDFVSGTQLGWSGPGAKYSLLGTVFVSGIRLEADIPAALLDTAGTAKLRLVPPGGPGCPVSNTVDFQIQGETPSPVPVLNMLEPSFRCAGSEGFVLSAQGSGFDSEAKVLWGSDTLAWPPGFTPTPQETRGSVGASRVADLGTVTVSVRNDSGLISNSLVFTIGPAPALGSVSPSSASAGSASFLLIVHGTGLAPGTQLEWSGPSSALLPATFVSSAQLEVMIDASLVSEPGVASLRLIPPSVSGCPVSNRLAFQITAGPVEEPSVTAIEPSCKPAGSEGFTLSVTGAGFLEGASVLWAGTPLEGSSRASAEQMFAPVSAARIASPGAAGVSVANPGGITSNSLTFTVFAPVPAPVIASVEPLYACSGTPSLRLILSGSGFVPDIQLQWIGATSTFLPAKFVNSTQLEVNVPSDLLVAESPVTIQLRLFPPPPAPGCTSPNQSNTVNFVVTPCPAVDCPKEAGYTGTPYSDILRVFGGTGGYTWQLVNGGLPPGLNLDPSGALSGTPNVTDDQLGKPFAFEAAATPEGGGPPVQGSCSITIYRPAVVCPSATAYFDAPYRSRLSVQNGGEAAFNWQITSGALPDGLTLDPATGWVSGRPRTAWEQSNRILEFTVEASGVEGVPLVRGGCGITVVRPSVGKPGDPPGVLYAELPDAFVGQRYENVDGTPVKLDGIGGTPPYHGWSIVWGNLPEGLRLEDDGRISGRPTSASLNTAGCIPQPDSSALCEFRVRTLDARGAASCAPTDQAATGCEPTFAIRVRKTTEPEGPPLRIVTSPQLPTAYDCKAYFAYLQGDGGKPPYRWSVAVGSTLPEGLSIIRFGDRAALMGVPRRAGIYRFRVELSDRVETVAGDFVLEVQACADGPNRCYLRIVPEAIPPGRAGRAYEAEISVEGYHRPFQLSMVAGELNGLLFRQHPEKPETWLLSGTPAAAGEFPIRLRAVDSREPQCTAERQYQLAVHPEPPLTPTLTTYAVLDPVNTCDVPLNVFLVAESNQAGPLKFRLDSVPKLGALIDAVTGLPASVGWETSAPLVGFVAYVPLLYTPPGEGAGESFSYTVTDEHSGLSANSTAKLPSAPMCKAVIVSIDPTYSCSGAQSLLLGVSGSGFVEGTLLEWSGPTSTLLETQFVNSRRLEVSVPPELLVASSLVKVKLRLIPPAAPGDVPPRPSNVVDFVLTPCPAVDCPLEAGYVGTPYSDLLRVYGGTGGYTWQLASGGLPPGLNLDPSGTLSGTPIVTDDQLGKPFAFEAAATPEGGGAPVQGSCSITIYRPEVACPSATAYYDAFYRSSLSLAGAGNGGTFTWRIVTGAPPVELALDTATGEISGYPRPSPEDSNRRLEFTAEAAAEGGVPIASRSCGITVTRPSVAIKALPDAIVGEPYRNLDGTAVQLEAQGAVSPFYWSLVQGALPAGLRLHQDTGVLDGTPTSDNLLQPQSAATRGSALVAAQDPRSAPSVEFDFRTRVVDSNSAASCHEASSCDPVFAMQVKEGPGPPPLRIVTPSPLPTAYDCEPYLVYLEADGGRPPYRWSVAAGSALPEGLFLTGFRNRTVLLGTPREEGLYTFKLLLSDQATTIAADFSLEVQTCVDGPARCYLRVLPGVLPAAQADKPYEAEVSVVGNNRPFQLSMVEGDLNGLVFQPHPSLPETWLFSGTPAAAGEFPIRLRASGSGEPQCPVERLYRLAVHADPPLPPSLTTTSFVEAGAVPFNIFLIAESNLNGPLVFRLDSAPATGVLVDVTGQPVGPGWQTTAPLAGSSAYVQLLYTPPGVGSGEAFKYTVMDEESSLSASGTVNLPSSALMPPVIHKVEPPDTYEEPPGGDRPDQPVVITGEDFGPDVVVKWGRHEPPLTPESRTPERIEVDVPGAILLPGIVEVRVIDPKTGLGSQPWPFLVRNLPVLERLEPEWVYAGGGRFTLSAHGRYFEDGAQVIWNGRALETEFVSDSLLHAEVPAELTATVGRVPVVVRDREDEPSSAPLPFDVIRLSLSSLSPSQRDARMDVEPVSVTLAGAGFGAETRVAWRFFAEVPAPPCSQISWEEAVFLVPTEIGADGTRLSVALGPELLQTPGTACVAAVLGEFLSQERLPFLVNLPAAPELSVATAEGSTTLQPQQQPIVVLKRAARYPFELTAILRVRLDPTANALLPESSLLDKCPVSPAEAAATIYDGNLRWVNQGSCVVKFTIPRTPEQGPDQSEFRATLQTGTTAGTIHIESLSVTAEGYATGREVRQPFTLAQAPPSVHCIGARSITGTEGNIEVALEGYSVTREISAASFVFNLKSNGGPLSSSPSGVADRFANWYRSKDSITTGTQFRYTQTFDLQPGGLDSVQSIEAALTNSAGTSTKVTWPSPARACTF